MTPANATVTLTKCPFCGCHECTHWIGWTEDGRIIELRRGLEQTGDKVRETDRIVKTGVSARVYRERKPYRPSPAELRRQEETPFVLDSHGNLDV